MPYDSFQYLQMADAWYWGTPFSFARRPGFPLFLAVTSLPALPLRLIFELFYLFASARLATAMVNLGFPGWAAALGFAFTIMAPYSFIWFNFAMVECMLSATLLWATAEFAYLLASKGRKFWIHNAIFSVLVLLAWFSRSETVLLLAAALGAAAVFFIGGFLFRKPQGPVFFFCLRLFGPAIALVFVGGAAISSLNYVYFGRFSALEDLRAPAYVRAYDDLQDISSKDVSRYVPVNSDQMQQAAMVSPAFAEIYPSLKGAIGDNYRRISKNEAGVDGEIAGGWLMWALGESVDAAGYHGARAKDAFYLRVAREIEAAADGGKITLIHFPLSLVDPHWRVWGPFLPNSILSVANRLIPYERLTAPRQGEVAPEITQEFDRRANRRASLIIPGAPDPRIGRVDATLSLLGRSYRLLIFALSGLAALLFFLGGWKRLSLQVGAFLALIGIPIVGRVCLIALLDASSYPTVGIDRYVMPASVLIPAFAVSVLALIFRNRSVEGCDERFPVSMESKNIP